MTYDTLLTEKFNKMTYGFVGLGLIGSSIAKAFRRAYKDCRIIAFNRSEHASRFISRVAFITSVRVTP